MQTIKRHRFTSSRQFLEVCYALRGRPYGATASHKIMTIGPTSLLQSRAAYGSQTITRDVSKYTALNPAPRSTVSPAPGARAHRMTRKRRTVLWLYNEDYEYLSSVADQDMDSKNVSMHRLVKALRNAGVKSFLKLDESLKRLPPGKP